MKVTAEQDDDAVDEEEVTITHTVSSTADSGYNGVAAASVAVTVTDDDVTVPRLRTHHGAPGHTGTPTSTAR